MSEIDTQIKARTVLTIALEKALEKTAAARNAATEAKQAVIAYDAENPHVMFWVNKLAGDAKRAERGSSGTVVSAEGHATLASAKGAGK